MSAFLGTNVVLLAARTRREIRTRRKRDTELAHALREVELRAAAESAKESLAIVFEAAQMGIWDADLERHVASLTEP